MAFDAQSAMTVFIVFMILSPLVQDEYREANKENPYLLLKDPPLASKNVDDNF